MDYDGKDEIRQLISAFGWAMKNHLREHDYSQIDDFVPKNYIDKIKCSGA